MVKYDYDPARKFLVATVSGVVRGQDFHRGFPEIAPGTLELVDMTGATENNLSAPEVQRLANIDLDSPQRVVRMAIVADSEVGFGLCRMYEAFMEGSGIEIMVFRDKAAALAWLGIAD